MKRLIAGCHVGPIRLSGGVDAWGARKGDLALAHRRDRAIADKLVSMGLSRGSIVELAPDLRTAPKVIGRGVKVEARVRPGGDKGNVKARAR